MRLGNQGRTGRESGRRVGRSAILSLGLVAASPVPAQTVAGTAIDNVAAVAWTIGGQPAAGRSNPDRLIVAERLDVRLLADPAGSAAFDLINAGTGEEAFLLAGVPLAEPSRALVLAVDLDGDGRCDRTIDRPLLDGRTDPLAPGTTVRLVACDGAEPLRVLARAATGSGAPGTSFDRRGDGGGDAVVGPTGASATLVIGDPAAGAMPGFVKSQLALAPDGSARAAAGGTIAYTLAARFDAAFAGVAIEDPLPAGTRLVPGSLALDGRALSEAADDDAGELADGVVRVRLGDVAAGSDHRVTFTVTVTA